MAAASNSLITVDYYKQFAEIPEDSTAISDEAFELLINQASTMLETVCNRKFITPASDITEIFDGTGNRTYYVKQARLSASPTTLKYWSSTVFTATSYTWTYHSDTGRVYFTDGNVFDKGSDNWEIVYSYGWTQATIPQDLKMACAMLVEHLRLARKKVNITSESFGDASTSYDWQLPSGVKMVIDNYKVVSYG